MLCYYLLQTKLTCKKLRWTVPLSFSYYSINCTSLTNNNRQDIAFARQVAATIKSFQNIHWDDLKCRKIRHPSFTNVTNEERNNVVRFIKDPSNPALANTSNNFHCVVLSLFFRRDQSGDYIQNMRVRILLWFFKKYILHLLIFSLFSLKALILVLFQSCFSLVLRWFSLVLRCFSLI